MDLALLIEQAKGGDQSAGAVIVSIIAPQLLGYGMTIGADLGETEVLLAVENAVEKAVERIDRFDSSRGTFQGWARTFVLHEIQERRRQQPEGARVDIPADLAAKDEPAEVAITAISAALSALVLAEAEEDQLLLKLRFGERLEHNQIAELLGVSEAASRKRLQRILERMRQRAADDPDLKHLKGDSDE